jgi:hypothetical protein
MTSSLATIVFIFLVVIPFLSKALSNWVHRSELSLAPIYSKADFRKYASIPSELNGSRLERSGSFAGFEEPLRRFCNSNGSV